METAPPGEEAPSSGPIEVEVKFAVGPGTEAALAALGAVGLPHIPPFRDCYFDGPGAPLGRADVWLRHRQGQGWQLKLPHGDPRLPHGTTETHRDARAAQTPPETAGSSPRPPHSSPEPPHSSSEPPHSSPEPPHSPPPAAPSTPEPPGSPELPHSTPKPPRSPPQPRAGPEPPAPPDPPSPPATTPRPIAPPSPPGPRSPPPPPPSPGASTAYREVWGDAGVLAELIRLLGVPSAPWGGVGAALGPLGLRPTASFVTRRRSARLGGLRVELDQADFGYGLGEVEEVVGAPREVAAARRRVEGLCRALGAEPQRRVPGKLSVFLARHRPRYYRLLRAAGRLEGLEDEEEEEEEREGGGEEPPPHPQ